jgi:DNA mismatch repair protein MutS
MLDLSEFKNKYNYDVATPMMKQYLDIKFVHQNSLVLFRMGDFYELFFDDAITASQFLGLALAKRGKHGENDLQMCGVPHHALESYLYKLIEEGFIVAICEQLESPEEAKKRGYKSVVKRDVVRIITPGTIIEESILQNHSPNYLVSIKRFNQAIGIAYLDISTAEFKVTLVELENFSSELAKLNPKEIIISETDLNDIELRSNLANYRPQLVVQVDSYFATQKCQKIIERFYNIYSYTAIGPLNDAQVSSVGAILEYVNITQKNILPDLPPPHIVSQKDFMIMDVSTRRNLELQSTISGNYKGSLLSVVNHTLTKAGTRLLYNYLCAPLTNIKAINTRHDAVEFLFSNMEITRSARSVLREISDIERIIMRISMRKSIPRDLFALHLALEAAKKIYSTMKELSLPNELHDFNEISKKIESIIRPDSPNSLAEGGFVKKSYNMRLAELYDLLENNNGVIEALKLEYQAKTGIDSLKICKNNLIGIFIEVTQKNLSKMSDSEFIHKQTIASSVRFTTEKLRALEIDIMNSQRLATILEQEIFWELCDDIMKLAIPLRQLANNLSIMDVYCSFAHLAKEHNYVRPEMEQSTNFLIENGRHVTVDQNVENFVPNNCDLSHNQRLWLITGPNMAGKSTFLRQNALIIILAQMGSFVPGTYAKIGIVDRLFSRIGASDDLAKGQSTFMVEMLETAMILAQSTENSFIILDEIGRGTSTYDGVSIAWGCLEHIHNILKCRSLFATHYHELTSLSGALSALKNHTISIKESNGEVLFLHKIIPGIADKSYGIHVAELAGIPKSVIKRAYEVLKNLEKNSKSNKKNIDNLLENNYSLFDDIIIPAKVEIQGSHEIDTRVDGDPKSKYIPDQVRDDIIQALADIKPDEISPKKALELLYELKKITQQQKELI